VHRQKTMSLLGFPLMRHIDVNDCEEVYDLMRLFPQPTRTAVGRVRAPPVHATGEAVTGAWCRGLQRVPRIAATTDAYVDRSTAVSDA
jgi:Serine dehydrogenase proteinase